ncbi:MAG: signal peptide peptidase SppA, partial [Planctomycetes bacterium]|nr:signal peptide peptidase SppA [Planctomycetota bacterium]
VLTRMKKARTDDRVKAVVLLLRNAIVGSAQVEELRREIDRLKQSGKKVYAHADRLTMRSYVLLSGASRLSLVPTADIWITGIYAESPYLRGLLDMIGVVPDYMTCGDYKSAAEIFMRKGPSPQAQEMLDWLMDSRFDTYLKLIAEGRGVSIEQARKWVDVGLYSAKRAKEAGLIDAVEYRQDFVAYLKKEFGDQAVFDKKYGKKKSTTVDLSSSFGLLALWAQLLQGPAKRKTARDQIAIVYVDGPIVPGTGEDSLFGTSGIAFSTPIRKALDRVANAPNVKGVVLRINSPGGSAVASEIILNAAKRVKAKKPFVVSMGDVAGSGGDYVACGTDMIFADASTITGSIGVVGGKFATTAMWNKVGITWHATQRGARAGILSSADVFSPEEREVIQSWMDEIYETFKSHVVAARGKRLKKEIDQIAGGRVYTGQQALELGLIDRIGGLEDAIAYVAKQAKLEKYEVRVVPRPKNFVEILFGDLAESKDEDSQLSIAIGAGERRAASIWELALPWLRGLDARRVRAIRAALERMDLIQREGAVLMMPEVVFREAR